MKIEKILEFEKKAVEVYGYRVLNPIKGCLNPDKEKEYQEKMEKFLKKNENKKNEEFCEIVKKVVDDAKNCYLCEKRLKTVVDDICITKYGCCDLCFVQYIEGKEEEYGKGWRPSIFIEKGMGINENK